MSHKKCKICNSKKLQKTIKYLDWNIYKCQECRFRFADDGKPLTINEHYDESYFKPLLKRDEMSKWAQIYSTRLSYLQENSPNNSLLEVGAGASTFAVTATDYGFEVDVVDGSPWAVEFLSAFDGIIGMVGDLNAHDFPLHKYGAIHCSHVLEHLSNPLGFLQSCLQSLAEGGLMYLSFPAYEENVLAVRDSLYKLGLANYPYNYQAPDHISYFDASCIRKTLLSAGFEVVSLRRTKFISLNDSLSRMEQSGRVRQSLSKISNSLGFVTNRVGFHRDLEIIARRPVVSPETSSS